MRLKSWSKSFQLFIKYLSFFNTIILEWILPSSSCHHCQYLASARVATGRLRRVLSLSGVDHIGDIPSIPGHGVGHLLQPTVGQVDEVLALGVVAVPALSLSVVVLGVVVRNSVILWTF